MLTLLVIVGLAAALAVALAGCTFYNRKFETTVPPTADYELHVIQVDDFGSFWSVPDAQQTLNRIAELAKSQNTYVFLFIHGWHHNAAASDENFTDFQTKLKDISARLHRPAFTGIRIDLSGTASFRVVGVYVGWRGRSLPGWLNYGTMWWRKAAAERVGDGDVREFILQLQRLYLRTNSIRNRGPSPPKQHFMGLVTVGHSFGGQVLLTAVAEGLEVELAERARTLSDAIHGDTRVPSTQTLEHVPIDGFGDVNILVNPATEAYQYARIDDLVKKLRYPPCQLPQLVVFSADIDRPRQFFFPIARGLTRAFRPGFQKHSIQGALWGTALGEWPLQQTHDLKKAAAQASSLTDADYQTALGRAKIQAWDFSGSTVFNEVALIPLRSQAEQIANNPVAVVSTHDHLIQGHNGIFGPEFWGFVVDYVTFLEGKRMLWRQEWLASGSPSARAWSTEL